MTITANRICPGTTIVHDGRTIEVRAVEPDIEPGFVWVTNTLDFPRHARLAHHELVEMT